MKFFRRKKSESVHSDEEFLWFALTKNPLSDSPKEMIRKAGDSLNDGHLYVGPKQIIKTCQRALENGQFQEVLTGFIDPLLAMNVEDFFLLHYKALFLAHLGKYDDSIFYFDRALSINPNNIVTLNNKATTLGFLGKLEEVLACCDKVLAIEPDDIIALSNKGGALANLGKYDDALACLDKSLELDPNDESTLETRKLVEEMKNNSLK